MLDKECKGNNRKYTFLPPCCPCMAQDHHSGPTPPRATPTPGSAPMRGACIRADSSRSTAMYSPWASLGRPPGGERGPRMEPEPGPRGGGGVLHHQWPLSPCSWPRPLAGAMGDAQRWGECHSTIAVLRSVRNTHPHPFVRGGGGATHSHGGKNPQTVPLKAVDRTAPAHRSSFRSTTVPQDHRWVHVQTAAPPVSFGCI